MNLNNKTNNKLINQVCLVGFYQDLGVIKSQRLVISCLRVKSVMQKV